MWNFSTCRQYQLLVITLWVNRCSKLSSNSHCLWNDRMTLKKSCIKFCNKLGDTQKETIWKIQQNFAEDAMSIAQIKELDRRLKNGCTSVESKTCSSRPSTSRNDEIVNKVQTLIMEDCCMTIEELQTGNKYWFSTFHYGMGFVSCGECWQNLCQGCWQWSSCVWVSQGILECIDRDPNFLNTVIIGYELWAYEYNPKTKFQSSQ